MAKIRCNVVFFTSIYKAVLTIQKSKKLLIVFGCLVLLWIIVSLSDSLNEGTYSSSGMSPSDSSVDDGTIHVAAVACGDRVMEGLMSAKSIWINCPTCKLHFHMFTDEAKKASVISERMAQWKTRHPDIKYTVQDLPFQEDPWMNLFRPCASARLFIHNFLTNVEWLIYLDSDTLAVSSVQELWDMRAQFTESQIFGATVETHLPSTYSAQRNNTPFYEPSGINSGVLLMNLHRIRQRDMIHQYSKYYDQYWDRIRYGDQCLLNVLFHFQPNLLFLIPASWNFRTDFCVQCVQTKSAEGCLKTRPRILHGNRKVFLDTHDADPEHDRFAVLFRQTAQIVEHSGSVEDAAEIVATADKIQSICFSFE